jgi:hypothetical protein
VFGVCVRVRVCVTLIVHWASPGPNIVGSAVDLDSAAIAAIPLLNNCE